MANKEAVAFSKSASGFLTDRTANTIAAAVTNQIPIVSIRDAVTALSHGRKLAVCSGISIGLERKRGMGSFVSMRDASVLSAKSGILASASYYSYDRHPCYRGLKSKNHRRELGETLISLGRGRNDFSLVVVDR